MRLADAEVIEAELASYYDDEGDERLSRPIEPERLRARDCVLRALAQAEPKSVLEVGSGPGRDAAAFIDAGHRYVAVDLSIQHAKRCRSTGGAVARASVRRLPFRASCFDLIWTMSTLMHVPDSAIDLALSELSRVLKPGGMAAIGVWGGPDVEERSETDRLPGKQARFFSRRSSERWRSMLAAVGRVDAFETWGDDDKFFYQWAVVTRR
jgi:SAM-dependent methyltransferase